MQFLFWKSCFCLDDPLWGGRVGGTVMTLSLPGAWFVCVCVHVCLVLREVLNK